MDSPFDFDAFFQGTAAAGTSQPNAATEPQNSYAAVNTGGADDLSERFLNVAEGWAERNSDISWLQDWRLHIDPTSGVGAYLSNTASGGDPLVNVFASTSAPDGTALPPAMPASGQSPQGRSPASPLNYHQAAGQNLVDRSPQAISNVPAAAPSRPIPSAPAVAAGSATNPFIDMLEAGRFPSMPSETDSSVQEEEEAIVPQ